MHYMVMDMAGNAISAFESGDDAARGFATIVHDYPESASSIALLTFDEDGEAVGDAIVAADFARELVTHLALTTQGWYQPNALTLFSWDLEQGTQPLPPNEAAQCVPA